MQIKPISTNKYNPSFKWRISSQTTRYGKSMVTATEYHRDSGLKLVVVDMFYDGKLKNKVKELYDKSWHLIKSKTIKKGDINVV